MPKLPNTVENATWAMFSAAGLAAMSPTFSAPLVIITRAVMVRTTKVSINTQTMATTPWSWGFSTLAMAWAWGVEPMPASLENRPRATP